MHRAVIGLIVFSICSVTAFSADTLSKPTKWYFNWGYTRAWYGKSTLHIKDLSSNYHALSNTYNYYDLYFENVTASDRPDFDKINDVVNISIPQFVFRLGRTINALWDFEINYDHTKYIVNDYQSIRVYGQMFHRPIDTITVLDPKSLLHFEHSDGANFFLFNVLRKIRLLKSLKHVETAMVIKPGLGFVFPRTDVTIFGERLNNNWHVAGLIAGLETGIRVKAFHRLMFEFCAKGSYADYTSCLVVGAGNGTASHSFFCGQLTGTLGFCF